MSPLLSLIGGLAEKVLGKVVVDKDKQLEMQANITMQEVTSSGETRLKAWRGFIGWICGIVFGCLVLVFPIIALFFPNTQLPDFTPYIEMVFKILLGMLALA